LLKDALDVRQDRAEQAPRFLVYGARPTERIVQLAQQVS
jgi:hypothetical protein